MITLKIQAVSLISSHRSSVIIVAHLFLLPNRHYSPFSLWMVKKLVKGLTWSLMTASPCQWVMRWSLEKLQALAWTWAGWWVISHKGLQRILKTSWELPQISMQGLLSGEKWVCVYDTDKRALVVQWSHLQVGVLPHA